MTAPVPVWLAATARARDAVATALSNARQEALEAEHRLQARMDAVGGQEAAERDPEALEINAECDAFAVIVRDLRDARQALRKILDAQG